MNDTEEWTPVLTHKRMPHASLCLGDEIRSPKRRVAPQCIQQLIRKRMELQMTQDKADQVCHFPKNTFRNMESHRILPSLRQQQVLQQLFGITIRILTIRA